MYKLVCNDFALVAELVDAADLKSVGRKAVPVRFRPSAPIKNDTFYGVIFYWYDKQSTEATKPLFPILFNRFFLLDFF